ncbi:MAG: M20/M25/M40 family metallo-hydrolase [Planctomycetes bacterium]|nr:M20/M25/M40 family metallo-hydrolase [Planctomycetota bacterium]
MTERSNVCRVIAAIWFACGSLLAQQEPAATPEQKLVFTPTAADIRSVVATLCADELRGRRAGSPGAKTVARWIAAEFEKLGLTPAGDAAKEADKPRGFEQCFRIMRAVAKPNEPNTFRVDRVEARNVLAWLPGAAGERQKEYVLVGAHFDHLGDRGGKIHPGADDNASGVAGLIAVARALTAHKPRLRRSVLFVAFGGEEEGLRGSNHFARKPPRSLQQLVAMINLDMIGRPRLLDQKGLSFAKRLVGIPDAPAVGVLGTDQSPELAALARSAFATEKLPLFAPENFGVLAGTIKKMSAGRSDHAPFEQRGIPFLFFSTSEHDDYHKPTDTIDKIDPETTRKIAAGVFRILVGLDAMDGRPRFVRPEPKPSGKGKVKIDPDRQPDPKKRERNG